MSSAAPEIGSEFHLTSPPPPAPGWAWRANGRAAHALSGLLGRGSPGAARDGASEVVLRSGRDALALVTEALARSGARVLFVPAFGCDSLWLGGRLAETRALAVGADLLPTRAAIEAAAALGGDAALLAVPLFGRPLSEAARAGIRAAAAQGVTIIEDASHSLLSAGATGALGLASLRKWAALPDGAVAWGVQAPEGDPRPVDGAADFADRRRAAQAAKGAWLARGEGDKQGFLDALGACEQALDGATGPGGMSEGSLALLADVDWAEVRRARRSNHEVLRGHLDRADLPITQLFPGPLGDGVVPLGLPVLFADGATRDRVRRGLIARRIYCALHWPLPETVPAARYPAAADGAARILTLPCDQRYGPPDMDRVATALSEVMA